MPFAFKSKSAVGHQVRAIARSQIEKALQAVEAGGDFDETVHALRRRCKKLRGLLRLVQPNFEDFKSENAALRDAADLLGGARDARVMVETLDGLVGGGPGQVSLTDAGAARAFLVARADSLARQGEGADALERFRKIFARLGERAAEWSFDTNGFDLVGDGLEKTYKRFLADLDAADRDNSAEALHEWRKQAKYHFFHVTLLTGAAPDLLEPRAEALDALGKYLGDHHNLAVLAETLGREDDGVGELSSIREAVERKQEELDKAAFAVGQQLAAEKASALRKRFEAYWALLPEGA